MVEEQGKVVALDNNEAWVQTIASSTCGQCQAQKGCGQKVLADMSQGRANQIRVFNSLHVKVGDEVVIGVPEDVIVLSSFIVYIMPLALAAAAGLLLDSLHMAEWLIMMAAGAGLLAGFSLVSLFTRRHQQDQRYQPQLLRRVSRLSDHIISPIL